MRLCAIALALAFAAHAGRFEVLVVDGEGRPIPKAMVGGFNHQDPFTGEDGRVQK